MEGGYMGLYYMFVHMYVCVNRSICVPPMSGTFMEPQLEDLPAAGLIHPGPRTFLGQQNKLGEETKAFLQTAQEMIGEDFRGSGGEGGLQFD